MIRLIVADMDGTLLDDGKQPGIDFWEVQQQLAAKGILFAAASGRQYDNLLEIFYDIRDQVIFIAENGTYVVFRDEQLHLDAMDWQAATRFIQRGRAIGGAYLILCGKNSAYVESDNPDFLREARSYYRKLEIVPDLLAVKDLVLKVTICDFRGSEIHSYPVFQPFEDRFSIAVSGKIWLDITNLTADKGAAIRSIQRRYQVSYDETLVFGDFLNDLEMMKAGKYSYAMKNAHPGILEVSSFITRFDNNHNGVTQTIRELGLV